MIQLKEIVIKKIMNEWEYIAYALYYDLATIRAIREEGRDQPKTCCEELFKNWLQTNNGAKAGRKVWSTLFHALRRVEEIASATIDDMFTEVKELK